MSEDLHNKSEVVISIENLQKKFGDHVVLNGVDLIVKKGQM